jgi:hypothetical protein
MFPAILIVSLLNGIGSPLRRFVEFLWPVWLPEFVPPEPMVLLHGSSLLIAFGTMLVGGVPAAIWERVAGQRESDTVSMMIWLAAVGFLSLPALTRFAG